MGSRTVGWKDDWTVLLMVARLVDHLEVERVAQMVPAMVEKRAGTLDRWWVEQMAA